jgi:hypothetical protein
MPAWARTVDGDIVNLSRMEWIGIEDAEDGQQHRLVAQPHDDWDPHRKGWDSVKYVLFIGKESKCKEMLDRLWATLVHNAT